VHFLACVVLRLSDVEGFGGARAWGEGDGGVRAYGFSGGVEGDFGSVVVLAEVGQGEELEFFGVVGDEGGGLLVGEVAFVAGDASFEPGGVVSVV